MDNVIAWFQTNWVGVTVIVLALNTFLKAVRDALDKTPETDDNIFEKAVSLIGKICGYVFVGKRPA